VSVIALKLNDEIPVTNMDDDKEVFSQSIDVVDSNIETEFERDENGYYWQEYPVGSGQWYYRVEPDSEWIYWES
jgi:hypothetical protein